ncbi:DUF305 domain-containing protein, partial [Streptomyces sp. NPDC005917]|uniref:DUF305 domain-containing protein n=1 Tax=Streptomyces sp. NPDC005917 TaxID=3155347 RepID=UPI00340C52D8
VAAAARGEGEGGGRGQRDGTAHSGAHATPNSGAPAGASAPATTAGAHNAQDVTFAQSMIPHHQQALEMAALAADRASSARVQDLAARIEKAQDPEIKTMSGWLKAWGEDVPMAGMDHSGHTDMAGMMDDKDMTALKKAEGKDFDTMFLTMMVQHHQGAVDMATTERSKGEYAPATSMAGDIVTAQNAEVKEMNKLLGKG